MALTHTGVWRMNEARCLLNLCVTFSGNLLFGDFKWQAVVDYLDECSKGHLDNLAKECKHVKQSHLDAKWELVLQEARDREILDIFEERRIAHSSSPTGVKTTFGCRLCFSISFIERCDFISIRCGLPVC